MHAKSRHILVIDVSQPKELSLKVGNSRKNIVHYGKRVKYNMLETCQVLLWGEVAGWGGIYWTLIQQAMRS